MIEYTTCKLIFNFGAINEEGICKLLSKYTSDFTVNNFYPDFEVGCNRITFAVVDVPEEIIQKLAADSTIKEVDPMTFYSSGRKTKECSGGSCGCGP